MRKWVKQVMVIVLCITMLSLCGCDSARKKQTNLQPAKDEFILYYVSIDSTQLVPVAERFDKNASTFVQVQKMIKRLTKASDSLEYKNVLPDKVKIQSVYLSDKDILNIDLSKDYYDSLKAAQILLCASLVKSLTQIAGVDMVNFTVDSNIMTTDDDVNVGTLTADSFVDSDAKNDQNQVQDITLYFADQKGDKLEPLAIPVNMGTNVSAEQLVIEQLIAGTDEKGYYNTIPKGTKLLSVSTKDGVCYVDFNDKFLELDDSVKDQIVIYSVVNSLCELSTVSKVAFTINGSQKKLYNGNIAFDQMFERKLDLVDKD